MAESLDELLVEELKDIYSAEKQAVRAYPKIAKSVDSDELKQALQAHLEQTQGQLERLEQVFEILEEKPGGKTCEGMKGLLEEANEAISEGDKGPVLDAQIIGAAQRVEHYEIAAYGTVSAMAKALGKDDIAKLLDQTLQEEKDTDQKLTQVSEGVNQSALENSEGDEEGDEDEPAPKKTAAKKSAKKSSSKR